VTPDEFAEYRPQLTRNVRTKIALCDVEGCICGNECVVWSGALDSSGYASFKLRGVVLIAHRYAYTKLVGPIVLEGDDDPTIDHLCVGHRNCMNVHHMEIVSRSENSIRANNRRHNEGYSR
jgi:hypothetical protein